MYTPAVVGKLLSIANLIGESGEPAKQPLPDFLSGLSQVCCISRLFTALQSFPGDCQLRALRFREF
jgi:hypothetical protein